MRRYQWVKRLFFFYIALFSSAGNSTSSDLAWSDSFHRWQQDQPWVTTISAGPGWSENIHSQTFFLKPGIEKTYTEAIASRVLAQGELFIGAQTPRIQHFSFNAGIALGMSSNQGFNGEIWEDANPAFKNFNYDYLLTHSYVAFSGKVFADGFDLSVVPYIHASMGVAFNQLHHFGIAPLIDEEIPAPVFQPNTTTTFTYILGVGMQRALNKDWIAGVEYTFSDWGKGQFSKAQGQTFDNTPGFSNFYVNSVMFNISYLIK
jgi:opacity protein-like surface antigen